MQNVKIVRKSFKPNSSVYHTRQSELQNLATLKLLKDPCIVRLLGSYTYRDEHSFLFPMADGGDLSKLLSRQPRPSQFGSDDKFLLALLGLANALDKVHHFSYTALDISLIGCHHDLKPKNVLVHGDKFLLADFGLSKFKTETESSKTTFRVGGDHYLAPECEEYEGDFQQHRIGRPADIWSFGCILAEIITYMNEGSDAVQLFKEHRRIKIGRLKTYTFHAGRNAPNPHLYTWLSRIEAKTTQAKRLLVDLVRKMLSLDPKDRPRAKDVSTRIAFIAAYEIFHSAQSLLSAIARKAESYEMEMAMIKLECYGASLGFMNESEGVLAQANTDQHSETSKAIQSDVLVLNLLTFRDEMSNINTLDQPTVRLQILRIPFLVDQLWSDLPSPVQIRAANRLKSAITRSCDLDFLRRSSQLFGDVPEHRRLALLASIKRTTLIVAARMDLYPPVTKISENDVQITGTFEVSSTALVTVSQSGSLQRALIEWLYYDCDFNEELLIRVEAITELLGAEKPPEFLGLNCSGFYHDISKPAFGLVFPFPEVYRAPNCTLSPLTLQEFIENSQNVPNRPLLGHRFELARQLSASVLEFHTVGWLHKCLSSFSVMLFYPADSKAFVQDCIQNPFIIGFSHSRPDEPNAYTKGPKGNEREEYQHPDYVERKSSFSVRFDYYSLGIILLEIGLWMSVITMRQRWKSSTTRKLRKELIDRRVPLLGHSMGESYCRAVIFCLSEDTDKINTPEVLRRSFEQEVIERLANCIA
jgi:serine/threonine protein kinase